jgi:hypothetical protein
MAEQLTPIELNIDYMENPEMIRSWIHRSSTPKNKGYHYIELLKQANSFTKANVSPGTKFSRSFLISWRNSTQWGPLLPKGGRNDPGGYWWPPTYSTWTLTIASFSFLVFAQFTILNSFFGSRTSGAILRP